MRGAFVMPYASASGITRQGNQGKLSAKVLRRRTRAVAPGATDLASQVEVLEEAFDLRRQRWALLSAGARVGRVVFGFQPCDQRLDIRLPRHRGLELGVLSLAATVGG